MSLRPYQDECLKAIQTADAEGRKRQLVILPTGTGKTKIASNLPARLGVPSWEITLFLVGQEELAFQAMEDLQACNRDLKVTLEKAEYHADDDADIIVASVDTLARSPERLVRLAQLPIRIVFVDEAHGAVSPKYIKVLSALRVLKEEPNPNLERLLVGLSVAPESICEFRGGPFGRGWIGTIESAYNLVNNKTSHQRILSYEFISCDGSVQSRGWNGSNFEWKSVKSFIRHEYSGVLSCLKVRGSIVRTTPEHSIYTAVSSHRVYRNNRRYKVQADITCADAKSILPGHITVMDDGMNWDSSGEIELDIVSLLYRRGWRERCLVAVDISPLSTNYLKSIGVGSKQRYCYRRIGVYGSYLPLDVYMMACGDIPQPTKLYWEAACGNSVAPRVKLSDWAYILGFFLGDGWVTGNCISFAVESARKDDFMYRLINMAGVTWNPTVRKMKGDSVEIKCGHVLLAEILDYALDIRIKCYQKRIPGEWITTWPAEKRRELLQGLVDSDGHRGNRKDRRNTTASTCFITTSKALSQSLLSLLRSLGIIGSIYELKPTPGGLVSGRRITGKRISYHVYWSTHAENSSTQPRHGTRRKFFHGALSFEEGVVKSKRNDEFTGMVYDLEMDGHPSFVANGILVHNTATPRRFDGIALGAIFDDIVFRRDIREMIGQGWLAEPIAYRVDTGVEVDGMHMRDGDFATDELSRKMNTPDINALAVKKYLEYGSHLPAIAFTVDIQHSEDLAATFRHHGLSFYAISSNTPKEERKELIRKHKRMEILGLCSCQALLTGFDSPPATVALWLRPTCSGLLYTQGIGRVERPYPAPEAASTHTGYRKNNAIIVDFCGVSSKHRLYTAATLYGLNPQFDFAGQSITATLSKVEELQRQNPTLDITAYAGLNDLKEATTRVDLWQVPSIPKIAKSHSQFIWQADGDNRFRLAAPGVSVFVEQNHLGEYEVYRRTDKKIADAHMKFAQPEDSFAYADSLVPEEMVTLIRANAQWRKAPPKQAQCEALWKRDPIVRRRFTDGTAFFRYASMQFEQGNRAFSRGNISLKIDFAVNSKQKSDNSGK